MACLSASAATAVIPDMKFRRLDARDGLSNSQINYMFQDSRGFIWIGTSYGLNRYDGYRFRHITLTRAIPPLCAITMSTRYGKTAMVSCGLSRA